MNRKKKAFVAIATTAVLLDATSAARAAMQEGERSEYGGSVVPCSLDGVNPAHHPRFSAIQRSPRHMASSDRRMALGTCDPVAGADLGSRKPAARYRGPPMTLANMRAQGVRSL